LASSACGAARPGGRAPSRSGRAARVAGWLVAAALAGACAPGPRGAPPAVDVTGTWEGEWLVPGAGRGSLAMTLTQRGARVQGEVALTATRGLQGGPLAGWVSGERFVFRSGDAFHGEATVEGNRMTGRARATQVAQIVLVRRR
jgi:hypothetical protein